MYVVCNLVFINNKNITCLNNVLESSKYVKYSRYLISGDILEYDEWYKYFYTHTTYHYNT